MNRRNFIVNSGLSLAGLLVGTASFTNAGETTLLVLPDEVWIDTGAGLLKLTTLNGLKFIYQETEVLLSRKNDCINVEVKSPVQALYAVQLKWKKQISPQANILNDHWERTYGDVSWQAPENGKKMPWYFLQYDGKRSNCFGVKTGTNTICHWQIHNGYLQLSLDTRSGGMGVQLAGRTLNAATIITTQSLAGETPFSTGKRFCKMMCATPRLPKQPVYGINDWYFAYGKSSAALILQHTALLADLATDTNNRPFSVVDAGWAYYSPLLPNDCCWQDDFSRPNEKFKDMHKLAEDIIGYGMRPGLWTRPLCAAHDDSSNLLLPSIPGRDNPKNPVLDPTIDENIERVKKNISIYKAWGYHMVKHDFSTYDILGKWGFQMNEDITTPFWRFNKNTHTTAEIILNLYHSIREAAGSMYLIGCNTIGHLSAGIFELNRIGDDTSGNEWERTRKMGVNTLAFRGIHHKHFYAADADCVGLTTKVPWQKNKQWMQLLAESGTPLFISAQPDALGEAQRVFIKQCYTLAAKELPVAEPMDWMNSLTPSKWKLNGRIINFDWT